VRPVLTVSRVLETCLYATDLETAGCFYEEVLGLVPLMRVAGRHIFFRAGSGVFLLFNPERTSGSDSSIPQHGSVGPGHVAFAMSDGDIDNLPELLRSAGVEIEADVVWPGGGRSIYLRDPAGNSVELTTPSIWGIADSGEFDGPTSSG
jgi:catechol 2,3-dioxygenase-like lactoylglutathione lyase family enzyme